MISRTQRRKKHQFSTTFFVIGLTLPCQLGYIKAFRPAFSGRLNDRSTSTKLFEHLQSTSLSQQGFGFVQMPPEEAMTSTSRPTSLSAATLDTFMDGVAPLLTTDVNSNKAGQLQMNVAYETFASILSASLLITSNTVGAGCLVLPELALQGPGMLASTGIFLTAYFINLISGLIIAQIAIIQKEKSGNDTPSSFKEFARVNLNSDTAAHLVSSLSLLVNVCVLSFDLDRVGIIGSNVLQNGSITPDIVSCTWAAAIFGLIATQSSRKLSEISSVLVTALFVSFGGLLLPGLANVADPVATMMTPGQAEDLISSIGYITPIILMSMIFQNIVPTVVKLLNYDRFKTVASLIMGSSIPLVLYLSWIFACLGGGIDTSAVLGGAVPGAGMSTAGTLLTVFSLVTIGGSSLCGGVSVAEELETYIPKSEANLFKTADQIDKTEVAPAFQISSAFASLAVPLVAALTFASGDQGRGLTDALALAGSIGSPLLYGAIPAYMAYNQLKNQSNENSSVTSKAGDDFSRLQSKMPTVLVPSSCLPIVGALSIGYVSQELTQNILSLVV